MGDRGGAANQSPRCQDSEEVQSRFQLPSPCRGLFAMDEKYYIDDIWYENIILHFCPKYLLLFPLEDIEREEIRGTQGNDYIAGTDGHDLMTGLQGDDTLLGSPGWDEFRGGYGNDIVDYSASKCAVDVSLERGYGIGGDAHGDTYQGIESVWGSEAGDT